MIKVAGHAAEHSISSLKRFEFERDINDCYKRVEDGDGRFRYVIDMSSLRDGE